MPEGLEAEIWRRSAQVLCGRRIVDVSADERVVPEGFASVVVGSVIEAVERVGKVLRLVTDDHVIGLHFGMTGRLVVDGTAAIERLTYASGEDRREWDRLVVITDPPGSASDGPPALRMNDPRRLGRISLDESLDLGADFSTLTADELRDALRGRRAAIKTLLLDQHVVAGLGNLCADEVLFWAGVAPHRRADELGADDLESMATHIRERLAEMLVAGGSTSGTLSPALRSAAAACPLDGAALRRSTVGGRTAVWCPTHQR